jgi:hypothetical protein
MSFGARNLDLRLRWEIRRSCCCSRSRVYLKYTASWGRQYSFRPEGLSAVHLGQSIGSEATECHLRPGMLQVAREVDNTSYRASRYSTWVTGNTCEGMVMGPGSLGARTVVGPSTRAGKSRLGICTPRESVPTISTADVVASRNDSGQGTMQFCFSFDYY